MHSVQVRRGTRPTVSFDAHPSINSGETGSGKSENRCLAIKSLLKPSVSNLGKKGSKLATQLPAAEFVLETFGNARTQLEGRSVKGQVKSTGLVEIGRAARICFRSI